MVDFNERLSTLEDRLKQLKAKQHRVWFAGLRAQQARVGGRLSPRASAGRRSARSRAVICAHHLPPGFAGWRSSMLTSTRSLTRWQKKKASGSPSSSAIHPAAMRSARAPMSIARKVGERLNVLTLDDLGELIADDEPRIRCDGLQRIVSTSFAHASSMPRGVGLDSSGTRVAVHTTYSELEAVKMDDLRASLNQRITARIALPVAPCPGASP